jgi:hypothetical protein
MRTRRTAFFAGAAAGAVVTAIALAAGPSSQTVAHRAAKYPMKVVLENNRVRVRDVTFPPGVKDTGLHTHELPHVGVILTSPCLSLAESLR